MAVATRPHPLAMAMSRRWQSVFISKRAALLAISLLPGWLFFYFGFTVPQDAPTSLLRLGQNAGIGGGSSNSRAHGVEYSIKPIAYIFPAFHPFKENDENWGANWTEWDNVRKVDHNKWGTEVLKPAPEVGYYDLRDYETRERQGRMMKEIGIWGTIYHHYWFGQGPMMDAVLKARLEDNQPDLPFMLNWANEPWVFRWDTNDRKKGDTFIPQVYGDMKEWREHFDWLLPFFCHPSYIRSGDGKKVLFGLYELGNIGDRLGRMMTTWDVWAAEAGLGGLECLETRIDIDPKGRDNQPNQVIEFAPRSRGLLDPTSWPPLERTAKVYHRGIHVGWDNTPRHATDNGASGMPYTHPGTWKYAVLRQLERIKLDPNPPGEHNFLFINALNEWGEGNTLEPSLQWGDRFGKAFKEAMDMSASLPWQRDKILAGTKLASELAQAPKTNPGESQVDVCVLVPTGPVSGPGAEAQSLPEHLRSLQLQNNPKWRAVLFPAHKKANSRVIHRHLLDTYGPRVRYMGDEIPKELLVDEGAAPWATAEWVLKNRRGLCEDAKYFMVSSYTSVLAPTAFDVVAKGEDLEDIVGLNVVSIASTETVAGETSIWNERCSRFTEAFTTSFCAPTGVDVDAVDLGAVMFSLPKFIEQKPRFGNVRTIDGQVLVSLRDLNSKEWSFREPGLVGATCDVTHRDTYPSCTKKGWFWVDTPRSKDGSIRSGCFSGRELLGSATVMDMKSFQRGSGFCNRLKKEMYDQVVAESVAVEEVYDEIVAEGSPDEKDLAR